MKYIIPFLFMGFVSLAQTQTYTKKQLDSLPETVKNQFIKIFQKSGSYQSYKVISKKEFLVLQKNTLDTISAIKSSLMSKKSQIKEEQIKTATLNDRVSSLETELNEFKELQSKENNYSNITWGVVGVLALSLLFLVYKFRSNNYKTKEAQNNLFDLENEFEQHKKRSLEREQKLRRQLQDEINKQRGVS